MESIIGYKSKLYYKTKDIINSVEIVCENIINHYPNIHILSLLRSNASMQHSKVLYRWGVRRKGKMVKHRKVGVKRKWWVLALFPARKWEAVTQDGTIKPRGLTT